MLSEADKPIFKKWLVDMLKFGPTEVTFTKKDGSERIMNCTLQESMLPAIKQPSNEKMPKETSALAVFDIDKKEWRSFCWDSVKSVKFNI